MALKQTAKGNTKAVAKGKVKEEVKETKKPAAKAKEAPATKKSAKAAPVKETKKPAAKAAPVKETKKPAKGAEVKRGRGRVAGVRSEVQKKDAEIIQEQFSVMENEFTNLADTVDKFLTGNKAAVSKSRKSIQAISRMGKELRKTLQDSKLNMKTVSIK